MTSFENPDLDIPENNVIACYRCRAEVTGSEFVSWKDANKNIFQSKFQIKSKNICFKGG